MPLSWNEIRKRAHEFSKRWEGESSERAEAQSFWNEFFSVFGIERKRVAIFEKQVQITRASEKRTNITSRFTSPTELLNGATKRAAKRRCIVSSSASPLSTTLKKDYLFTMT